MRRALVILAAVVVVGCGLHIFGHVVTPEEAAKACRAACDLSGGPLEQVSRCLLACDGQTPGPTPSPVPATVAPVVTPTAPVATPTPQPPSPTVAGTWATTLKWIQGFGGCNPYPCDPTTPACAAEVNTDETGKPTGPKYPVRSTCKGDRTALYNMPGLDLIPQGTGCESLAICLNGPPGKLPGCVNNCKVHDGPGTPCGGAAACAFPERASCPRSVMGCNGMQWDAASPAPGSHLSWSGVVCVDVNGFSLSCTGAPGTAMTLCTEPWPGARTVDGRFIIGGSKFCRSGFF